MSSELEAEIARLRKEVARLELIICQRHYNVAPENVRLAALEEAARECEELGQASYDEYEKNKEDYPPYACLRYAESGALAKASNRIRALKGEK